MRSAMLRPWPCRFSTASPEAPFSSSALSVPNTYPARSGYESILVSKATED
jgi:hypothetical protein